MTRRLMQALAALALAMTALALTGTAAEAARPCPPGMVKKVYGYGCKPPPSSTAPPLPVTGASAGPIGPAQAIGRADRLGRWRAGADRCAVRDLGDAVRPPQPLPGLTP